MRDFLKAFGNSFITAMSGICSVVFWAASALGEALLIPVSVRIGFIVAAALSMYYAGFRVWKDLTKEKGALEQRIVELEGERVSHHEQLHRARTSDPHRNALRQEVDRRIGQFRDLENRATGGPIPAEVLYPLEEDTYMYLRKYLPAFLHFEDNYPLRNSWGTGEMVKADEARQRCRARIARLSEALTLLG